MRNANSIARLTIINLVGEQPCFEIAQEVTSRFMGHHSRRGSAIVFPNGVPARAESAETQ